MRPRRSQRLLENVALHEGETNCSTKIKLQNDAKWFYIEDVPDATQSHFGMNYKVTIFGHAH